MATLDELKLQQLLQPFEGPEGIATLNPLAFKYQDQQYLNQDPTQDFYEEVNISPTQNFYPLDRNPTQMFYQPREFVNAPNAIDYYQPDLTTLRGLDMNRFQGVSDMSMIDETTDDEQVQFLPGQKEPSGIAKLFELFQKFSPTANIMKGINSIRNRFDTRNAIRNNIQRDRQGTINEIVSPRIMNMRPTNEIDRGRGESNIASRASKGPTGARRGIDSRNKSSIDPAVGRRG
jgi:hypothetical protein